MCTTRDTRTTTSSINTDTKERRRKDRKRGIPGRRIAARPDHRDGARGGPHVTFWEILLQQVINGLSLGAMYALLALGFTMVYGIIELINFAHFNVFMVGSFIALWLLQAMGIVGQGHPLYGLPLIGVLATAFAVTMLASGVLGVAIERLALRPLRNVPGTAAMITTIGVSYILFNVILLGAGAGLQNHANALPPLRWAIGDRTFRLPRDPDRGGSPRWMPD